MRRDEELVEEGTRRARRPAAASLSLSLSLSPRTKPRARALISLSLSLHALCAHHLPLAYHPLGPHANTWPDAGTTPFRGEKNTNWEGAYRVPCLMRWPGQFPAGTVLNGIVSHADW